MICEVAPDMARTARPDDEVDPAEQSKHILCVTLRFHPKLKMSVAEVADWFGVSERTVVNWTRQALTYFGHPVIRTLRRKMAEYEQESSRERE